MSFQKLQQHLKVRKAVQKLKMCKVKISLALIFTSISLTGFCTTWTVNNSGNSFSPANITITFGDSVNYVISTNHDAREVSQATWNSNGNTALPGGFQTAFGGGLVLPAKLSVGIHYFVCTPHAAVGMKGTITVQNCTAPGTPGSIGGNASVCSTSSNTYSIAAVTGATSYSWTLPVGWAGSSTTNSITAVAGITGGDITVTANNACGVSSAQLLHITVNTAPNTPGTINGNTVICSASLNNYDIIPVAGATSYNWTLPGGWTGASSTNSITAIAGSANGNITVNAINACGTSAPQILNVTVNSAPNTPGIINGSANICLTSSNIYDINAVSGATSYNWSLPGGWIGSSTSISIAAIAGNIGGDITVSANNACGTSANQSLNVTVISAPNKPGTISGSATVCSATSNTYSITPVPDATSYTWSLPGGWTGSSTTNSITAIAGITGGDITVSANNACGISAVQTLNVSVNSAPNIPGTINGNATICSSTSNIYDVTSVPGATSYNWSLPGGWTGTSTSNSITAIASATGGDITVSAINTCGSSAMQILNVTVNTPPDAPSTINGNSTACQASSLTYDIAAIAGATSYNWTLPGGWTGSSTTNFINVIAGNNGGDIMVSASNTCGTSAVLSYNVTVDSTPNTPGIIYGNTTVCGASLNTYSIAAIPYATSYSWALPNGWTGSSTTNTLSAVAGTVGGNIIVAANNNCGSSGIQTIAVTVSGGSALPQPGAIIGSTTICSASSNTYSINAVAGATSYTWTLPGDWTGSSTTNSITAISGSYSGEVTVSANNSCGSSAAQTLNITVKSAPATPGSINGSASVCPTSSNTYNVISVPGATTYIWSLPGGWTGSSTVDSITAVASNTGGDITVISSNVCGSSSAQIFNIAIKSAPSMPGTIHGITTVCPESSIAYDVTAVSGATSYTWTWPVGWTASSTTDSIICIAGTTSGNITITANNNCGSSAAQTLSVNVSVVDTAVSQSGTTLTALHSGASYKWINCSDNTLIAGQINQNFTATSNGNYAAIITQNGCYDTSSCYNINTIGINEISSSDVFTIFPNPSDGIFQLTIEGSQFNKYCQVEIINALGQNIFHSVINKPKTCFNLNKPAKGIYFVKIHEEQTVLTKVLIIH